RPDGRRARAEGASTRSDLNLDHFTALLDRNGKPILQKGLDIDLDRLADIPQDTPLRPALGDTAGKGGADGDESGLSSLLQDHGVAQEYLLPRALSDGARQNPGPDILEDGGLFRAPYPPISMKLTRFP